MSRRAKLIAWAVSISGVYGTIGLLFIKYHEPVIGMGCVVLSLFAFTRRALSVHTRL